MGGKVAAVMSMLIVIANAIKVNITESWKPDFGWQVICSWEIPREDSLQSVRLSNNGMQFMIYRPEKHGPVKTEAFGTPEMNMYVNCAVSEPSSRHGQCELQVEPLQPPIRNFAVKCEVSGERPTFKIVEEEHLVKILVPPSNATLVSNVKQNGTQAHVSLNCSSSGLPAPSILWTIDDDKRAEADFTGRAWNATSKLWHVWSFLTYTPADHAAVLCTPIVTLDGHSVKGVPVEYNSARRYLSVTFLISTAIAVSQLLR